MTLKPNKDNGLQIRTTEHQLPTAVWRNGGCSASYDSFVVGSSVVLRLNFCAKTRHYAKPQNVIGYLPSDVQIGFQNHLF